MALFARQSPSVLNRWVTTLSAEYFTAISGAYTESKMKYKFILYDYNGEIINTKNPPLIDGGIGAFSPTNVLRDSFSFKFQPDILKFAKATGGIIQYQVKCEEFNATTTNTQYYDKVLMIDAVDKGFNYLDYQLDGPTKQLLTNYKSTRKVTLEDRGTFRALSGQLVPQGDSNPNGGTDTSWLYQIRLERTLPTGYKFYYKSVDINPFYGNTTSSIGLTPNSPLSCQDVSEWLVDFPSGPWNINQMKWRIDGYQEPGGIYIPYTDSNNYSNFLDEGDTYDIYAYCWAYGGQSALGLTSQPYTFEVVSDSCKLDSVQFAWQNSLGGTDYFTAMGKKAKTLNIEKLSFEKNLDYQGGLEGYNNQYIGHNDYDRGETIYDSETTENWTVNTDFLTRQEILDLEYLWSSKEVFVRFGDNWYPIIITNNSPIIERDENGLKQYDITFRLANKKYNG